MQLFTKIPFDSSKKITSTCTCEHIDEINKIRTVNKI